MERVRVRLVSMSVALAAAAASNATVIDFELGGPDLFVSANPLRNEYMGVGAMFTGPSALTGGAILNIPNGGWGVDAFSGTDGLAFNALATMANGGVPIGPERVDFMSQMGSVSLQFSGGNGDATGRIEAFDSGGTSLGFSSVDGAAGEWVALSISVPGIAYVMLSSTAEAWLVDDLTFEAVPEPLTLSAVGTGLLLLVLRKRK